MRRMITATVLLLGASAAACAHCPTFTQWGGGLRCAPYPAPGGGVMVLGFEAARSSYWQTDIDPRGNMYGYDPRGNYWRYDALTGTYTYYNTTRDW